MAVELHNQIIQQMGKEHLLPLGVFRKGRSRVYLDDNGVFFTVIEFQPSGFSSGTFLNVGMHPLWTTPMRDYLTFITEKGSRVCPFLPFESEAQFRAGLVPYFAKAKQQILYYRQFRDPEVLWEYATRRVKKTGTIPDRGIWEQYLELSASELSQRVNAAREYWRRQSSMRNMQSELY